MYWDDYSDYYEQEPSEVDEIVDDAVQKITDIITERAKDEIDSIMNKAKYLEEQNAIESKQRAEAWKETAAWKKKCEELTKELEKQRTELKLEFEVGEKVFFTRYRHDRSKKVFCSECGGTGVIKRIVDGEEYSKKCPKCEGNTWYSNTRPTPQKEVEYYEYYPEYDVIESMPRFQKVALSIHIVLNNTVQKMKCLRPEMKHWQELKKSQSSLLIKQR